LKKPIVVLPIALIMLGCSVGSLATPSPSPTGLPGIQATPSIPGTQEPVPTSSPAQPQATVAAEGTATKPSPDRTPVATPTAVPLFLSVSTPQDETITTTQQITVTGKTSPGAVVSVNGRVVAVSPGGDFSMVLVLEEGPNTIEVIASDQDGNEVSRIIAVIYQP